MLKKGEIISIIISGIILAFCITMKSMFGNFFYVLLAVSLVIIINVVAKKVAAEYFETEIETEIWSLRKLGFFHLLNPTKRSHPSKDFRTPVQVGVFLPILTTILTFGWITWLAPLAFSVQQKIQRAVKRQCNS